LLVPINALIKGRKGKYGIQNTAGKKEKTQGTLPLWPSITGRAMPLVRRVLTGRNFKRRGGKEEEKKAKNPD